jgi:hypothetical protein
MPGVYRDYALFRRRGARGVSWRLASSVFVNFRVLRSPAPAAFAILVVNLVECAR